ncbi:MAG: Bax inhibitor-1/YccA family protein [Sphingomonadales bacterium]
MVDRYERRFEASATGARAGIDEGLRAYMLKVYNYMAMGVALTGVIALFTANSPALLNAIYGTPLQWVVMLAPLALVIFMSARINKMSASAAQTTFWVFSGLMGLSLSYIFLAYAGATIARVFFISAGAFGALSLFGYTTRKDLSGWGSFLYMGLFGIILAMVVNLFMASSALDFAISVIGVLVFAGLTAYDTQKIKEMYYVADSGEIANKKAIMGALNLYLDFINLFLFLLRLFGGGRD